jgi:primosomal protein N' (replication factor Y)
VNRDSIIKVALSTPVSHLFDYLPAGDIAPRPGQRVRVPFGNSQRTGVVAAVTQSTTLPRTRLRRALEILDDQPLLDAELMGLLEWSANYYLHPPGEVIAAALPAVLRRGGQAVLKKDIRWRVTAGGRDADLERLASSAPIQAKVLRAVATAPAGLTSSEMRRHTTGWQRIATALERKGWLIQEEGLPEESREAALEAGPRLNAAQAAALDEVQDQGFRAYLLEGVTGSGKTEVYLGLIQRQISAGRQVLVLVPEIGLTPQLVDRFRRRVDAPVVVMHSGLSDGQRLKAWLDSHHGHAKVVVGTRSAIFAPFTQLGMIIVDEEHDLSYKQQEGFRYSARDLAVVRARRAEIPVVLGSATPSFESVANTLAKRYTRLELPRRAGMARPPTIRLIDLRVQPAHDGLTEPLITAMQHHLDRDGQVLLFLNRRGYAPTMMCPGCGRVIECARCDARMVLHRRRSILACHHCGTERAAPDLCPDCDHLLHPVGQGTERIEAAVERLFPEQSLIRIDRDTTRRRGEIERRLQSIRSGESRILLGTQMLTKGHDFPGVTLVGIIDADHGLFGTDFRSSERLAQTIIQVAGRAGRGERPGEVYLQTLYPDHPLLNTLLRHGYGRFALEALRERETTAWPPYSHLALLRAECAHRGPLFEFLAQARGCAERHANNSIQMLGPASSPMERRSGRYRAQLLLQSMHRRELQVFLKNWRADLSNLPSRRKTRWSLDIDPVELF